LPPPQHKTIHPKGMKTIGNVIETEQGSRAETAVEGSHVHMDIF